MSTIFTTNPIRVNLISLNNTIKQTIIFIGIVPNNIKSELIKIEKTALKNIKNENPILSKFYGRDWMMKLGLGMLSSKPIKKGGDEFSFDDNNVDDNVKLTSYAFPYCPVKVQFLSLVSKCNKSKEDIYNISKDI